MRHDKELKNFLTNEVELNKTRLEKAEKKYTVIEQELKDFFGKNLTVKQQGSYATNTIIKPGPDQNDEYDVDMLVVMEVDINITACNFFYEVKNAVDKNERKVTVKRHCVRVDYAGDFHLDIVPCLKTENGFFICDRETYQDKQSDGWGYSKWFNNIDMQCGNNVSNSVKLVKYIRDHKNTFTCPSIVLTTLIGLASQRVGNRDSTTEMFVVTLEESVNILESAGNYLENPVMSGENLLENLENIENLKNKLNSLARRSREALDEGDIKESIKKWQDIFGEKFGVKSESSATNNYYSGPVAPKKPHAI